MKYVRSAGRCPYDDFMKACHPNFQKKFKGSFDAVTEYGSKYENHQRFKPLRGAGKPLWEFKEFDNRLYCLRIPDGDRVTVVLFSGWEKQKDKKTEREKSEIERAIQLMNEYNLEEKRIRR